MKLIWLISALFVSNAFASDEAWRIHSHGFGPVKIGMTVTQASNAIGDELIETESKNEECYHVRPKHKYKSIAFMVQGYRITRVSLYHAPSKIKTDVGIALGDSEDQVKEAYKNSVITEPHHYGDQNDHYLTHWSSSKQSFGVRYETIGGKVEAIHGGSEAIQFVEGCL